MLSQLQEMERGTREQMKTEDLAERDAALNAMRLVTAARQKFETWLSLRALRAQLSTTA